jgi:hypothetical protein
MGLSLVPVAVVCVEIGVNSARLFLRSVGLLDSDPARLKYERRLGVAAGVGVVGVLLVGEGISPTIASASPRISAR